LVEAVESEVASKIRQRIEGPLEDSSEDEEEVMAKGESKFFIRNMLKSTVYVTYDCDRSVVKKESVEITGKLTGGYKGAEGSLEASFKNEKEFEHFFASKTEATAVVPGGFLEEGVAKSCKMIYATMYVRNKKKGGIVNRFMNTSGTHTGKVIELSGTADKVKYEKSYEVCGGQRCGCWKGHCWSYCSFGKNWCYTTNTYSQSFKYKPCSKNDQCRPGDKCAGACTV
jgi:hypothetical protein